MDLNSDAWRNLVFENKNKEYGAYYLRKTSSKRHIYAIAITFGIVIVLILSFFFIQNAPKTSGIELKPINLSELNMLEYVQFENIEIPQIKEVNSETEVRNTPPKIVSDEEVHEFINQTEIVNIPGDSAELTAADSIFLSEHKLKPDEDTDELVTYTLNPADSTQKSQSLQTTILRYVYHNLKYPDAAYKQRIKGKVVYSFIVNKDGSVSDIKLEKGVYIFLDDEVLRVIRSMPAFEPEKKDGKPIRVKFYLPVVFSL